jgi:methyl-accepting chemotaxis protein
MTISSRLAAWGPIRAVRESIRNKLLLTLMLLGLVPLLFLSTFTFHLVARAVQRSQSEALAALAREKEAQAIAQLDRNVRLLESAAGQRFLRERLRRLRGEGSDGAQAQAELGQFLKDLLNASPDLDAACIVDATGRPVAQTDARAAVDRARDAAYAEAMAAPGRPCVRPPGAGDGNRAEQVLSVTVPDELKRGPVLGVLVFRLNLGSLQKAMGGEVGQTGETFLVNPQRLTVTPARLSTGDTTLRLTVDLPGLREVLERQQGSGQGQARDYRGVPVLYNYRWLPEVKAALVCKIDADEAFDLVHRVFWLTGAIVATAVALVLAMALWLSNGLTRQVGHITDTVNRVGMGDFTARTEVTSADELGVVAGSLNAMLDNTVGLIQSREERDQIERSIQKLLEEISGVAEGDLSKVAEVTADLTGAIADSFNFMIEQLRRIISNVQDATQQVSIASNRIHNRAEELVQGSEGQAEQIVRTADEVEKMAGSIRAVAEAAGESARVADQALTSARQGSRAVNDTIGGMNRIRDQVQETAKRIKRLGESSQQIGEIVQLIEDIADRTSILALNAAIQAASAGEAGRGFAVVAQEVERLAERAGGATKKIAGLVKAIQGETREAVTAMEEGTREVVEGSRLANEAGQALARIETVSTKLAALIQSITEATRQQAAGSQEVARAMGEISEVTQRTAEGTRQAAVSVTHLAELADGLRDSVSTFRLPGRKSLNEIEVRDLPRRNGAGKSKDVEVAV